jgi:hypothetical protein
MNDKWPEISYEKSKETYNTIHLWTQIAGKIKLVNLPWVNHSWHVTLAVTPFGLTTGNIPCNDKYFQINFNFIQHRLEIITSMGENSAFNLESLSVASFYNKILTALNELGMETKINPMPNEIADAVPFHLDETHTVYKPEDVARLHTVWLKVNEVFNQFRAGFIGKCSPVHFFWGGFDLAVTRFSGRKAPLHPGGVPNMPDWVAREAYSHEVSSAGFWTGNQAVPYPAFYSYIYPEPAGFINADVKPEHAFYNKDLGEFLLPYMDVQQADDPSQAILDFLHSTYDAAASLAGWNRELLKYLP